MKQRDIELLSAYLDGELKPADSTKLEARLKTDPELASVLSDLRGTRILLRKLPTRKAPRNFTLTRKMAGQNPPLPRTYPAFRFVTTIVTLMFFFTFGINFVGTQLAASPQAFGMGGGGGDVETFAAEAPAMEEPAAPEAAAPMAPAPEEPSISVMATETLEEPSIAMAPQATEMPASEDTARVIETPSEKNDNLDNTAELYQPPGMGEAQSNPTPLIAPIWQIVLAVAAALGAVLMFLMKQVSANRWK